LLLNFYFHSAREPRNRRDSNKQKKRRGKNFLKKFLHAHQILIQLVQYYFLKRLPEPDLLSRKAKSDYYHIHHLTNYYLAHVVLIQILDQFQHPHLNLHFH
jgi:hypothetical protein